MKPFIPVVLIVALAFFFKRKWENELALSSQAVQAERYVLLAEQLGVDVDSLKMNAAKSYAVRNFDLVLIGLLGVYLVFGFAFHSTFPKG